ncbi:MAG TPA: hypothetical protein QKA14_01650 [Candidatus Megaira endosymbiont of Hartmannula sinica]|nr:hypothetical protein [Candidatus Megaera endosymbiont of Hartmannula sinica]
MERFLILGWLPLKSKESVNYIKSLINNLILTQEVNVKEYSFTNIGYSLGGLIGNIMSAKLFDMNMKIDDIISIDSPGSKEFIEITVNKYGFKKEVLDMLNNKLVSFVNTVSPINSLGSHIGKKQYVIIDLHDRADYSYKKTDNCCKKVFSYICGMFEKFNICKYLSKHYIHNMDKNISLKRHIIKKVKDLKSKTNDLVMIDHKDNKELIEYAKNNPTFSDFCFEGEKKSLISKGQILRYYLSKDENLDDIKKDTNLSNVLTIIDGVSDGYHYVDDTIIDSIDVHNNSFHLRKRFYSEEYIFDND